MQKQSVDSIIVAIVIEYPSIVIIEYEVGYIDVDVDTIILEPPFIAVVLPILIAIYEQIEIVL